MRRPEAVLLPLLLGLALAGCSRLDFVKPSAKSDFRPERPTYQTRGTAESRRADAARDQLALAMRAFQLGDEKTAERDARAALRNAETAADANTLLALLSERQGRHAQAGGFYRAAVERAPGRGATLNNYGAWLCRSGRAAESLPHFDAALQDPAYGDRAGALANAGACALDAGDLARVEPDLRAALELEPESAVALDAMARYLAGRERWFDARAFSQRRLAVAPATAAALQLAARIEQGLGDGAAAERLLQRLEIEFPDAPRLQPRETSPP
ncbi:hypothetical protein [Luteimonas sp. FCS-9]|uniref:hypothetical protein n=1 Tax=Luteimonas sp. FCS-9 TaxID=1547516 RepID=UPI00063EAA7C|nr:hypothetical protein [Luteimonas sp. FCS-9]KLJ02095.1 hypothetical protein WQ56_04515 [Luteimonas sp. FCS-9]